MSSEQTQQATDDPSGPGWRDVEVGEVLHGEQMMAALGETTQKLQAELQQAQEQIERLTSQLQLCREATNDSEMRWQGERRAFERVIRILNGGRANE